MAAAVSRYRVLIIAACPYPTLQGSQLLIKRLAEGLAGRGHEVRVVAYSEGLEGLSSSVSVDRAPGIPGFKAVRSGPRAEKLILDMLLLVRTLYAALRHRAQVLHAHNYEGALVGLVVSRLLRLPLVYHGHNAMAQELPTYFSRPWTKRIARALGALLDNHVPRRAHHCIAVSQELLEFLCARGVASQGVSYISPGAEISEFPQVSQANLKQLRRFYGIGERRVLLYTGNLDLYQNIELLFSSFSVVLTRVPDVVLVVATHSTGQQVPCPGSLKGAVRVIATDSFTTIRDLLLLADVTLCPRTEWSGFPMKLLNYMAAGKAIVASAGSAKAITHGYNGFIVPDGDSRSFAQAITELLNNDDARTLMGDNARHTVLDHYSWEMLVGRVEEVYSRVLLDKKRRRRTDLAWAQGRILKSWMAAKGIVVSRGGAGSEQT